MKEFMTDRFFKRYYFRKGILIILCLIFMASYVNADQKNAAANVERAEDYIIKAVAYKLRGNPQSQFFYAKAIQADPENPEYNLRFADYLRNFRGPEQPLFVEAEKNYYSAFKKIEKALKKIETAKEESKALKLQEEKLKNLKKRVDRGLVALYERDGFPIIRLGENNKPFLFFSTQNSYGLFLKEIRELSSDALFASSSQRLNKKSWSEQELRELIKTSEQFETLNQLRFRIGRSQWIPWIDGIYQYKDSKESQITSFLQPDEFNDVKVRAFGGALEWAVDLYPLFDVSFRGQYMNMERKGLIEGLPDDTEDVDSYTGKAVFSRFIGSNKLNLEFTYAFENIEQETSNPVKREREIMAGTLRYQFFTEKVYGSLFDPKSSEIFLGAMCDTETWGDTDVDKIDYFIGIAYKGLREKIDITLQPTIFTYKNDSDDYLENKQYRTNLTFLYRIVDKENELFLPEPGNNFYLSFFNLVLPMSHDVAIDGIDDFENFKVGIELDAKIIGLSFENTTFLASARYNYQQFYHLNEQVNLFSFNIKMGF